MANKIMNFLQHDIWLIKLKTLPRLKALLILHLRVFVLSLKGFFQDKCQLRASALTFFSLLSMVPVLAMSFGIAKGFGLERLLEAQIMEKLGTTQPEVADKLMNSGIIIGLFVFITSLNAGIFFSAKRLPFVKDKCDLGLLRASVFHWSPFFTFKIIFL